MLICPFVVVMVPETMRLDTVVFTVPEPVTVNDSALSVPVPLIPVT